MRQMKHILLMVIICSLLHLWHNILQDDRLFEMGAVHTSLIASKMKVSPIKRLSIPKLELCGAQVLAKLVPWTDSCSTIVLGWLSGYPHVQVQDIMLESMCMCYLELTQMAEMYTKFNTACNSIHQFTTGPLDFSNVMRI